MPEQEEHPAGAPLARLTNTKLRESHLHRAVCGVRGDSLITGKKRQLVLLLRLDIEHLHALEPGFALRVIDLAQIEHVALDAPASGARDLLSEAIIIMLLA